MAISGNWFSVTINFVFKGNLKNPEEMLFCPELLQVLLH